MGRGNSKEGGGRETIGALEPQGAVGARWLNGSNSPRGLNGSNSPRGRARKQRPDLPRSARAAVRPAVRVARQ
jgi:hypothetical protein